MSDLIASLKGDWGAEAPVVAKGADGFVRCIIAPPRSGFATTMKGAAGAEACARAFLRKRAALLHKESPLIAFEVESTSSEGNRSYLRFQQSYTGVPVYGAQVIVQVGSDGGVQYLLSDIMRDSEPLDSGNVVLAPSLQAPTAEFATMAFLSQKYEPLEFEASPAVLMIYEPSIRGFAGPPRLVWNVEAGSVASPGTDYCVIVDARTGGVVFHYPLFCFAMNREIYDANNSSSEYRSLERSEGDPASSIPHVNSAYEYLGDTYAFYMAHHGRDSIDGAGQTMSATVRYCEPGEPVPWNNAMWSGTTERMYFGQGHATDDIVGHELTHGVTQHTTRLRYENISGAINESFSDIWGEFVDLTNDTGTDTPAVRWHIGEDKRGGLGWRDMSDPPNPPDPSQPKQPDRSGSKWFLAPVEDPRESNDYGWVHYNSGIVNKLCFLLADGDRFNGFTVAGMGIAKVADLFYHVQSNRLIPANADFEDLYFALTDAAVALEWSTGDKANVENACRAVEINVSRLPVLSNAQVKPPSGKENSTVFEFLVDYSGSGPLLDYCRVYIRGIGGRPMTLKTGTERTYHHETTLPKGSYSYYFGFVDAGHNWKQTSWHSGPIVFGSDSLAVNIVIDCKYVAPDLEIQYSTESELGPWTPIPVTRKDLGPIALPAGKTIYFSVYCDNLNYKDYRWDGHDDAGWSTENDSSFWSYTPGPAATRAEFNLHWTYDWQPYSITGTVLLSDQTPVPGGVVLTLISPEQTMTDHTDGGNFSFSSVHGGVPVGIEPSAPGYRFSPTKLVFPNLESDKLDQDITALSSDDCVPVVSFVSVPPAMSDTSAVSFSWAGADDVSSPASLQYRWQLEGHDADWSAWSSATLTSYDGLPNGSYTFKVTAKDEAGNENQVPPSYSFVVNAAPKVVSAVRLNQSVWASRLTLETPSSAASATNKVVLVLEDSGMSDSDLVPVSIHRPNDVNPLGVNKIIATEPESPASIEESSSGWLVTLPEVIGSGQTRQYDIVWGKIAYFGWKEFVPVPLGFPNGGGVEDEFLDPNPNFWRVADKTDSTAQWGWSSWVFMNVWGGGGPIISETLLQFLPGQPWDGSEAISYVCDQGSVVGCGSNVFIMWQEDKTERFLVGSDIEDRRYHRYALRVFDSAGKAVNSFDSPLWEGTWITIPSSLVHDRLFVTADAGEELWFSIHDCVGNELKPRTVFQSTAGTHWSKVYDYRASRLGNNVALLFEGLWNTAKGDHRQEVCYQVWTPDGVPVKPTTVIPNQALLPDDVEKNDEYMFGSAVADGEGKLWLTIKHEQQGQPDKWYYCIIGVDGDVKTDLMLLSGTARFGFCDPKGYIWLGEGQNLVVFDSDGTVKFPSKPSAWIPDQAFGSIAALSSPDGYRLYDRWSPQTVTINVPCGAEPVSMDVYDLNLWGNDLHPADILVKKGDEVIWGHPGQFTGKTTVDVSGKFLEGGIVLTATQNDLMGGQLLFTFQYAPAPPCITGLEVTGDQKLKITWQCGPGDTFNIWSRADLVEGSWSLVDTVTCANGEASWADPDTTARIKFYRIERQ